MIIAHDELWALTVTHNSQRSLPSIFGKSLQILLCRREISSLGARQWRTKGSGARTAGWRDFRASSCWKGEMHIYPPAFFTIRDLRESIVLYLFWNICLDKNTQQSFVKLLTAKLYFVSAIWAAQSHTRCECDSALLSKELKKTGQTPIQEQCKQCDRFCKLWLLKNAFLCEQKVICVIEN